MDKIRVLLAEDHVMVREGTREFVQREPDMEVVAEAGDGEEAVRLAIELKPDVVVMDIRMPKLIGAKLTIQSEQGKGTTVTAEVPIQDNLTSPTL